MYLTGAGVTELISSLNIKSGAHTLVFYSSLSAWFIYNCAINKLDGVVQTTLRACSI